MSVLVLENFVFEEPDCSSGDTLVAAAALGALVRGECMEIVMGFLRQCVFFVFVSPDGSLSRYRSVLQGRSMRAIYPCGTGCVGKRLTESRYRNEKRTGEKTCPCISGRSAPYFAVVKSRFDGVE